MYVLEVFDTDLRQLQLYEAIRATCFKINISISNFYAILEMHYPTSGMFFHTNRRAGDGIHEM